MGAKTAGSPAEGSGTVKNYILWAVVTVLFGAAVYGNGHYVEVPLLYRVLAILALVLAAIFVALQTDRGRDFSVLFKEARVEIRKVVWPSRPETNQTTLIVVAFVLLMALILWALDSGLSWVITKLIG